MVSHWNSIRTPVEFCVKRDCVRRRSSGYYALGFFIGCFSANRLIRLVGHIRAFAILAAIAASFAGMIALTDSPIVWGVVRLFAGVRAAGLTVVTESWLQDSVPVEQARQRRLPIM